MYPIVRHMWHVLDQIILWLLSGFFFEVIRTDEDISTIVSTPNKQNFLLFVSFLTRSEQISRNRNRLKTTVVPA